MTIRLSIDPTDAGRARYRPGVVQWPHVGDNSAGINRVSTHRVLRAGNRYLPAVLVCLGQQRRQLALGFSRISGRDVHVADGREIQATRIIGEAGLQSLQMIDVVASCSPETPARPREKDRRGCEYQQAKTQQPTLTRSLAYRRGDGWIVHQ